MPIMYLIFGVLTTAVDFAVSFLLYPVINHHAANIAAWVLAVIFAFFTNRKFVFDSERSGFSSVIKEFTAFGGGRITSLLFQEAAFVVLVDALSVKAQYVKIPVSVGVVIINYFISKIIFKTNKKTEGKTNEA